MGERLSDFVEQLTADGQVHVGRAPAEDDPRLDDVLRAIDAVRRTELEGQPPSLDLAAARWAARVLHQACRAFVFREIDADAVHAALGAPCPSAPGPRTSYSVDLIFCYLPDVQAIARGVNRDDPLVQELRRLAGAWPLSSVGIKGLEAIGVEAIDIDTFVHDPSLRMLYLDRITAKGDVSRVDDPRVRDALCASAGLHPDLLGSLADRLENAS